MIAEQILVLQMPLCGFYTAMYVAWVTLGIVYGAHPPPSFAWTFKQKCARDRKPFSACHPETILGYALYAHIACQLYICQISSWSCKD